jgi:hypothetical protein
MSRALRRDETPPELVELSPDDPTRPAPEQSAPNDPTALRGAQRVSDARIFEVTPTEDTPSAEVAAAAGYVGEARSDSLRKRLVRMNKRAEAENEPPPFVITTGTDRYHQTMVRRVEQE